MYQVPNELLQQIDSWIEAQSQPLVDDIIHLVNIRSVSEKESGKYPYGEGCAKILDAALELSERFGFQTKNHEYHCGSCYWNNTGDKSIGIFAHLDVVPEGEGWIHAPYDCKVVDGYLVGRGVGDNKGPAVATLYALHFLKSHNIALKNNVEIYYGCDEEAGMSDIEYYTTHLPIPDFSLVPDVAFPVCHGEKGGLRFTIEALLKGNLIDFVAGEVVNVIPAKAEAVLSQVTQEQVEIALAPHGDFSVEPLGDHVKITASGLSQHAAFPTNAVNAIHVLASALLKSQLLNTDSYNVIDELQQFSADFYGASLKINQEDTESGPLTCVATVASVQNGQLVIQFDSRYPVTSQGEEIEASLTSFFANTIFSLTEIRDNKATYLPIDNPVAQKLLEVSNYITENKDPAYTMGGGTYARKLPNALGFGMGIANEKFPLPAGHGGGHQPDESIQIAQLKKGIKAYILALLELDQLL